MSYNAQDFYDDYVKGRKKLEEVCKDIAVSDEFNFAKFINFLLHNCYDDNYLDNLYNVICGNLNYNNGTVCIIIQDGKSTTITGVLPEGYELIKREYHEDKD